MWVPLSHWLETQMEKGVKKKTAGTNKQIKSKNHPFRKWRSQLVPLILDFQSPELQETHFCCAPPPSLWGFVTAPHQNRKRTSSKGDAEQGVQQGQVQRSQKDSETTT